MGCDGGNIRQNGEQTDAGKRTAFSSVFPDVAANRVRQGVESASASAPDYPKYDVGSPPIPRHLRDSDLFSTTQSTDRLIDISNPDDEWVNDREDDAASIIPDNVSLYPLHIQIDEWAGGDQRKMYSELGYSFEIICMDIAPRIIGRITGERSDDSGRRGFCAGRYRGGRLFYSEPSDGPGDRVGVL